MLTNPLPFAILAAFAAPQLLLGVLIVRYLQFIALNRSTLAHLTWKQLAAVPLLDLIMLYTWFVPFFSNEITWRGYRARIGRDTEMIQIAA